MRRLAFLAFVFCSSLCFAAKESTIPSRDSDVVALSGSFVYWQAVQDSMDFAFQIPTLLSNSEGQGTWSSEDSKQIIMKSDFDPGFKLGLAFGVGHDRWRVAADYTWYESRNKLAVNQKPGELLFLVPNWISQNTIGILFSDGIAASWQLKTSLLNVGLQRQWRPSKFFKVRPFLGVAFAWIDQKVKEELHLYDANSQQTETFDYQVIVKSRSFAVGPRISLSTDWYCFPSFCLIGRVGADLLVASYKLKMDQFSPTDSTTFYNGKDHETLGRPELDGYLGMRWEKYFTTSSYFALEAGYDVQVWWNQNMVRWFVGTTSGLPVNPEGNLYLQGLTVTMKLGF